ncbi:Uncharacterized protein APZ42_026131 [Daphnia magna]|uniref:Uncharacterized protein n=1 Tax=Daphnia magna TaxID=35525 RepID=A0A164SGV8_9CRUS|nr:Uncharacterized protein APZ42_026131 [Daphnia magna]
MIINRKGFLFLVEMTHNCRWLQLQPCNGYNPPSHLPYEARLSHKQVVDCTPHIQLSNQYRANRFVLETDIWKIVDISDTMTPVENINFLIPMKKSQKSCVTGFVDGWRVSHWRPRGCVCRSKSVRIWRLQSLVTFTRKEESYKNKHRCNL